MLAYRKRYVARPNQIVQGMHLAPIRSPHLGMYLAPIRASFLFFGLRVFKFQGRNGGFGVSGS